MAGKNPWDDDEIITPASAKSATPWADDPPAAQADLPKDVKPSTAGGGRGAVNPKLPEAPIEVAPSDPMGSGASEIMAAAQGPKKSLLERAVEQGPAYNQAQLVRQSRRANWEADQGADAEETRMRFGPTLTKNTDPVKAPDKRSKGEKVATDAGISLLKGAISVPEAAVGVLDITTGGAAGRVAERAGFRPKEAKAILDSGVSDEQKAANAAVDRASGVGDVLVAALQNPSVVGHAALESLPAMGAGGVIGRGLVAAGAARAGTAAAAGEGLLGAGSAAEQTRQSNRDGSLGIGQAALAAASGVGTGVFGLIGNRVAKSLGVHDVDTMLVGLQQRPEATPNVVRRVLNGAFAEGALEELPQSLQEQVMQNLAQGRPIEEGLDHTAVLGLLTGAGMGGAANVPGSIRGTPAAPPDESRGVTPEVAAEALKSASFGTDPRGKATVTFPWSGATHTLGGTNTEQGRRAAAMDLILQGEGPPPAVATDVPPAAPVVPPAAVAPPAVVPEQPRGALSRAAAKTPILNEGGPVDRSIDPVEAQAKMDAVLADEQEADRVAALERAMAQDEPLRKPKGRAGKITAEPATDTAAQVAAVRDPSSGKDAALITPNSSRDIDLEGLTAIETPHGLFVTSNPEKASQVSAISGTITDEQVGQFLGYTSKKADTDGTVVQALDAAGNVVHEEVTNKEGSAAAEARAAEMIPEGGTVAVTDATKAQARRKELVAAEKKATDEAPTSQEAAPAGASAAPAPRVQPEPKAPADMGAKAPRVAGKAKPAPADADAAGDVGGPAARPVDSNLAPAGAAQAPAPGESRRVDDLPGGRRGGGATFDSIDAATDHIKAQRARGATVNAIPFTADDGAITIAVKGTPEYERGLDQRQERIAAEARAKAGIMEGDILAKSGGPFKVKVGAISAQKRAGPGHIIVPVDGGFAVRKESTDVSGDNPVRGRDAADGGGRAADAGGGVQSGLRGADARGGRDVPAAGSAVSGGEQGAPVPPAGGKPDASLNDADPAKGSADAVVGAADARRDLPKGKSAGKEQINGEGGIPGGLPKGASRSGADAAAGEGGGKLPVRHPQFLGDGGRADTVLSKGFRALDVPGQARVLKAVSALVSNPQVFRRVVKAVPVVVMDKLMAGQLSPERGFDNSAVLVHALSANPDLDVRADAMDALVRSPAFPVAKLRAASDEAGALEDGAAAVGAGKDDGHSAFSPKSDRPLPSQAMVEAGNYAKQHESIQGLDITIENPAGSLRKGVGADDTPWAHVMSHAYGYVKGTEAADGDHHDVYVGPKAETAPTVYVIDQIDQKTGGFDETKSMLGFMSKAAAVKAYSKNFDKGWKVGPVTEMTVDEFKAFIADPKRSKLPAAKVKITADDVMLSAVKPAPKNDTHAFKAWFGDSKVVDSRGKPLVLFHGTNSDFTKFDPKRIGDNFGADERGFFFTSNPKEASDYAENDTIGINKREGANVMPAFVALKKPLVITPEFLKSEGMGGLLGKGGSEDTITFWDNYQSLIHEWVDERKADGVIVVDPSFTESNGEPRRLVVAFRPQQIKSAIGNNGNFDPKNADIRLSAVTGGKPEAPDTPAFKKWFGKSKAVDEKGAPLVVYHGTGTRIDAFDPKLTGKGNDQFGSGFYFTTDEKQAKGYELATTEGRGPKIGGTDAPNTVQAYLRITKPIRLGVDQENLRDVPVTPAQAAAIIKRVPNIYDADESPLVDHVDNNGRRFTDRDIATVARVYSDFMALENDFFPNDATGFREALHAATGFDGVEKTFKDGSKHFVAFFPTQIKSANENSGTFDPEQNDIRLSAGGGGEFIPTKAASSEHSLKASKLRSSLAAGMDSLVSFRAVDVADNARPELKKTLAAVRTVAKRVFGHDVVFVEFETTAFFNGAMNRTIDDTVFVRIDSNKPHMAVLGHELLHAMKKSDPTLYRAIEGKLMKLLADKHTEFYDDLESTYKAIGREMPDEWHEELWADLVGDQFLEPKFWQQMAEGQEGLFARVMAAVRRFLDGVLTKLKGSNPFGTNEFLTDVEAARALAVEAMSSLAAKQRDKTGLAGVASKTPKPAAIDTPAFKKWFAGSKVVGEDGKPMVMYHGTSANEDGDAFTMFDTYGSNYGLMGMGGYFTADPAVASSYTTKGRGKTPTVYPVYMAVKSPIDMDAKADEKAWRENAAWADFDEFKPEGDTNEAFFRAAEESLMNDGESAAEGAERMQAVLIRMGHDGITHIGGGRVKNADVNVRHKVVIAFDPEQIKSATGNNGNFDPSSADIRLSAASPNVQIPTPEALEKVSPELSRAVFSGAMEWSRDEHGRAVKVADLRKRYEGLTQNDKGKMLVGKRVVTEDQLKRWLASPLDIYDAAVNNRFEKTFLSPGVVWSDAELKTLHNLTPEQIDMYREVRKQSDTAISAKAVADMLRAAGADGHAVREQVLSEPMDTAAVTLRDHLLTLGDLYPERKTVLMKTANKIIDIADDATDLMDGGHIPDQVKPVVRPNAWEPPPSNRIDRFIYEMQDSKIDLKRTQEAITAAGVQIDEKYDARLAETLYAGRVAKRSQTFAEREVQPLIRQMARYGVGQDELGDYLHARGAPERNKQIAKVNPDMPDGGAGANSKGLLLTTANAVKYIADIPAERRRQLDDLAMKVDAITKGTRDLLVAEGLEKADTVAAWEGAYKHYVPMFREDVEFSRITVFRRAVGSEKKAVNILSHVLMQREGVIGKAERNRILVSLYGLALSNPNTEFWATIRPTSDAEQIQKDLVAMGVDPLIAESGMQMVPTITDVDPVTNKVTERVNPRYLDMPGAITLKVGGENRVLMLNVNNPRAKRMAENLKNQDGLTKFDLAGSIIGRVTRWMAAVNTQYNVVFGIVNFMRDTMGGVIHLSNTELRYEKAKVVTGLPGALAGIAAHMAGRTDKGKWSMLFEQFQQDGGQTGYREMFDDADKRAKRIERDLKRMAKGRGVPMRAVHGILGLLEGFNTMTENAVRLSAYAAAIDKGISRPNAARLARELTVDFNRKGRATRDIGPLYAFFNASLQGTERTLRALRGPAGAKIIAGGLALGVIQSLLFAAAGYDEDEVPEFIKARAFIIPLFNKDRSYISIPLPLGLHVIPNTGRVITDLAIGDRKNMGKQVFDATGEVAGAFNPLGGGNIFTMDGALRTIMPTVIDPLIEIGFNTNFAGQKIEREEGFADSRPGAARARESTQRTTTGQAYIGISKAINSLTGGTDFEQGAVSWTPERYRYLAQVAGGGVVREVEKIINATTASAAGVPTPVSGIPVVSRFYGEVQEDQVVRKRYYEASKNIDKLEGSIKAAKKAGDDAEVDRLTAKPEAELIRTGNNVARRLAKLNKLAVAEVSDRAAMKAIDEERTELMKELTDEVQAMEKVKPSIARKIRAAAQ